MQHHFSSLHDSDSDSDDKEKKPRGLTGLKNLGNTCYMNAAIQSLSNCSPLTQFFLDCPGYVTSAKKPDLSKTYLKLMSEMWHKRRSNYVCPTGLLGGIKRLHPMFKGFSQHDSQEFLRYLMDNLHEELKEQVVTLPEFENESNILNDVSMRFKIASSITSSDLGYDTSDSCITSDQNSATVSCSNSSLTTSQHDNNTNCRLLSSMEISCKISNQLEILPPEDSVEESQASGDGAHMIKENVGKHVDERSFLVSDSTNKKELFTNDQIKSTLTSPSEIGKRIEEGQKTKASPLYSSIISDIFDGQILSSVQCMTCETVSTTKENFQDLSLPLPSSEQIAFIRSSNSASGSISNLQKTLPDEAMAKKPGWLSWFFNLFQGVLWWPTTHLQDCLAAFFSADDLKGDNMYSCEKCKKLRNGVKYSKVLKLPEILCIHLKRFRHDNIFSSSSSSKISSFVSFPLERLDMMPYLHKDCKDAVTSYSLVAVICHHGTSSGGHYTAYALNALNHTWYEFDDQVVTEADLQQVENSQAYVLFYQKLDDVIVPLRDKVEQIFSSDCNSLMKFYISRKWFCKFNTFAEPGPINNYDFLCKHGAVKPQLYMNISDLVIELPPALWDFFQSTFGGGPAVNHLMACDVCQSELDYIKKQQAYELAKFLYLNSMFKESSTVMAINMAWFRGWENFVKGKTDESPGKIDNGPICIVRSNSNPMLLTNSAHGQMSEECWKFLHGIYGGGPSVIVKQGFISTRQHPDN